MALFKDMPILKLYSCGRAERNQSEIVDCETEYAAWKLMSVNRALLIAR